ncbi:DUF4296 domain-containing protein [Algoriphagus sp.]|uniref:DUF4296 domain-containing protein n=1 Tax=Algoriphagus sp. TaxID=1872435 RepID=UPI00261E745F|nr:DUF4296 domain-containing protein [Algoriphagus sp.]
MKNYLALVLTIFYLISCSEKESIEGVLSEDKMVTVLVDIHLTEGIASAMPVPYDSSQTLYKLMERDVFLKHEVSDSVFNESMRYYLQYPDQMDRIYARVIDSLVVRETKPTSEEKR